MKRLLIILSLLPGFLLAQTIITVPYELKPFVPLGSILLDYKTVDLNVDGRMDYVVVIQQVDSIDPEQLPEDERTLIILVRGIDGKLHLTKTAVGAILCSQCGGASIGDPYNGLEVSTGRFTIKHYGGSSWRWVNDFTFAYSKRYNSWHLIRVHEEEYNVVKPESGTKVKDYRPPRDYGLVDIETFSPTDCFNRKCP